MHEASDKQEVPLDAGFRRVIAFAVWIAVSTGLIVSAYSLVQEMCLSFACRDTASFTIFGADMEWFGIAYFSSILVVLWFRTNLHRLNLILHAVVFAGVGAEFRLLWIQKYIIGGWCPLCVTICCALCIAALLLLVEKVRGARSLDGGGKNLAWWLLFIVTMIAAGLATAIMGVHALV